MSFAIGLDPFFAGSTSTSHPGWVLLFPDVTWWLLETALILGLSRHRVKPRRAGTVVWLAVVWLLASAARFTPQILALTVT
ncbi:hypothetical protein [Pseudofrankia sp. BMG5.36]|uniref:hypothetical protein n=1 Tax=Pseudofrankia sp. BMG5.36 TaxID=1834512 RepID=UPI0008D9A319|nr:hypothetical protein [Pseudofrankia sp. BMG5.36]OHV56492.1 hypothetical protein BCD48_08500 [Pseudofrankia sp. BMG5.36]